MQMRVVGRKVIGQGISQRRNKSGGLDISAAAPKSPRVKAKRRAAEKRARASRRANRGR